MINDLNLLKVFIAVAECRNFSVAADRLDITRSAVSQGMRRLEDSLAISLVHRTTRSVHLTEAGQKLYGEINLSLSGILVSLESLAHQGTPRGLLRIAVTSIAERFLDGVHIASFTKKYPEVTLDVTVTDTELDIVEHGFDAGIRLGDVIEQDMIAIPITGKQREVVVATPTYIALHGKPRHPRELTEHHCVGWRPAPGRAPYRWEFCDKGQHFDIAVEPQITTNDMSLMVRTALADGGITFGIEETFRRYIERGQLVSLLEEYLPPFPGFYLYYPNRHNLAPKMRALIDHLRTSYDNAITTDAR